MKKLVRSLSAAISISLYCIFNLPNSLYENKSISNIANVNVFSVAPPAFSKRWLNGTRLSNINEDSEYVYRLILDGSPFVLEQSLAFRESAFVDWDKNNSTKQIAYRLAFLALHEHQHGPAKSEARSRKYGGESILLGEQYVGPFDYECDPDTKYLVVSFSGRKQGFAVSANPFVNKILAAMASDRVILTYHESKTQLFSCERNDLQCAFLPMSPCVITKFDLDNGYYASDDEFKLLLQNGTFGGNPLFNEAKVVVVKGGPMLTEPSLHVQQQFVKAIKRLHQHHQLPSELTQQQLQDVYDLIISDPWFVTRVAWAYTVRPNSALKKEIDRLLAKALPKDFDASRTIGLAIRQSDKCRAESKCMAFEDYMDLVRDFSAKRTLERKHSINVTSDEVQYNTIILTSEDKTILDSRFEYNNTNGFPFRFVVNDEDVAQGGWGGRKQGDYSADDVIVASFTSVVLQLTAESVIINGCSSFHRQIIWNLREMGFAKVSPWYTETLNQNDNPKYRMRCGMGISQF